MSVLPKPAGSHPVHHGDGFKNGQYRAIREIGQGSSSTVWLAIDSLNSRYVALKILTAKSSVSVKTELSIYNRLQQTAGDPLSEHVLMLLDSFEHVGPNGTHRCHVFQPMGGNTGSMVRVLPCNLPLMWKKPVRYPKWMAKKILKDTLSGIAFLHKNGVTHSDLQPGNLLFSTHQLKSISDDEQELHGNFYLKTNIGVDMAVKVSDLGAAFYSNKPPKSTITPRGLRAPELIFKDHFDSSIDIWAFGCLIYEFLTGVILFPLNLYDDDEVNDFHLLDLHDKLQPLPDAWVAKWPNARRYFGRNRKRLYPVSDETWKLRQESKDNNDDDEDYGPPLLDDDGVPIEPFIAKPLEILFDQNRPDDIDAHEAKVITTLIRRILNYEPSQRPSAAELMEDPWLKN